ncbi:hypothetical protein U1Q18_041497, partial [Sarracenia purpurea var. burkii]
ILGFFDCKRRYPSVWIRGLIGAEGVKNPKQFITSPEVDQRNPGHGEDKVQKKQLLRCNPGVPSLPSPATVLEDLSAAISERIPATSGARRDDRRLQRRRSFQRTPSPATRSSKFFFEQDEIRRRNQKGNDFIKEENTKKESPVAGNELKEELFSIRFLSVDNCKTFKEKIKEVAQSEENMDGEIEEGA